MVETVVALMSTDSTVCYVSALNHVKLVMVDSVYWVIEFLTTVMTIYYFIITVNILKESFHILLIKLMLR